jgi:hypothetical protein
MDSAGHDENIEEIHIREYAEHHGKGKGLGNIVEVSPEIEGQRKNGGEYRENRPEKSDPSVH